MDRREIRAPKGNQDSQVHRAPLVPLGNKEEKDHLDPRLTRVTMEHKVHRAHLDLQVLLGLLACRDLLDLRDWMVKMGNQG